MSATDPTSAEGYARLTGIETATQGIEGVVGLTDDAIVATEPGALQHAYSVTAPGDTGVAAGKRVAPRVDKTSGGTLVTLATALVPTSDGVQSMPAPGIAAVVHKNKRYTVAATGDAIWTPASGKRIVVTNCRISSRGTTAGQVTVWISRSAANDTSFTTGTDIAIADDDYTPTANGTPGSKSGPLLIPAPAADYPVLVTSVGDVDFTVMLEGYEV